MSTLPSYPRYGVYFCPEVDTLLWQLGTKWLGRDVHTLDETSQPYFKEISANSLYLNTTSPRKYGLHGTLKAPVHLSQDASEDEFLEAVKTLANKVPAFSIPVMKVAELGKFIALQPSVPCPELHHLAAVCLHVLDVFREPPTPAEITRRNPEKLSPAQRQNLHAWGYPYVLDEFRFHVTLSNSIEDANERQLLLRNAQEYFAPACVQAVPINSVCIFTQSQSDAPFILSHRFSLIV